MTAQIPTKHVMSKPLVKIIRQPRSFVPANDNTKLSGSEGPANRGDNDAPDRAAVIASPKVI
jgi:hypothetical protein